MKKYTSSFAVVLILSAVASFLTSCEPASIEEDNSLLNGILGDSEDIGTVEIIDEEVPDVKGPTYGPNDIPEPKSEDENMGDVDATTSVTE